MLNGNLIKTDEGKVSFEEAPDGLIKLCEVPYDGIISLSDKLAGTVIGYDPSKGFSADEWPQWMTDPQLSNIPNVIGHDPINFERALKVSERVYKALVLNDYGGIDGCTNYASKVKSGEKTIETRMNRLFTYRGDVVICCGAGKSVTANAGNALCIVEIYDGMPMLPEHVDAACIWWDENRKSLLLRNWRYFSRDFKFAPQAVTKNFQGIFEITIPDDVQIIPQPQILPYKKIIKVGDTVLHSVSGLYYKCENKKQERRMNMNIYYSVVPSDIVDEKYFLKNK